MERLRQQARQQVAPMERLPRIRRIMAILEARVQMMGDRAARLREWQSGYEQHLERLRLRVRELETQGPGTPEG